MMGWSQRYGLAGVCVAAALTMAACGGGTGGESPGPGGSGEMAAERETAAGEAGTRGGLTPGDSPGQVRRTTRIQVAGHAVTVEIADTPALRERGLMQRDSLPEDHGMLFVYPESRILSFWMVNTRIPLDIAFIDRQGTIIDIQRMEPETDEQHVSSAPAMYALEMEAGWFEEHGVQAGDRVEL